MPGHKQRSNKALVLVSILMCLGCGLSFTQSSATPSPLEDTQSPDMFLAGNAEDPAVLLNGSTAENTDSSDEDNAPQETPTPEPTPEATTEQTASGVTVEVKDGTYYASSELNLRSDASADAELIASVAAGTQLTSTGVCQNGWIRINYNGQTCYASGDYVSTTAPAQDASTDASAEVSDGTDYSDSTDGTDYSDVDSAEY